MKNSRAETACPCGSGNAYSDCCQRYISGDEHAPSAVALMRSRYVAYCLRETQYLLDSWHSSTRPASLELAHEIRWIRLRLLAIGEDRVEFIATYRVNGKAHRLRENSRFIREGGRWFYLDGELQGE